MVAQFSENKNSLKNQINASPKPAVDHRAFLDEAYSQLTVDQVYTHVAHQFKQSGNRHRGGCPFHQSKSGTSFVVSENSLLFHCSGCQFGGSGIDYLHSIRVGRWEKPKGKDFVEAAKALAELAGMTFPSVERSPEEIEKNRLWESRREILQAVTEYGSEVLWSSRGIDARNYLIKERGFTEEQIKSLNLGLYLDRKEVEKVLLTQGYKIDDIKNAGVVCSKLEGYILVPWNDSQGRPLTIYGRYQNKVPPQNQPKTIALKGEGTKQSPLYLDRALQAGHKEIVLVEGVLDAALLQSLGDTRVGAYVGASCSEAQIKTLAKRGVKSVTLCGDPDVGGENGTLSNINRILATGIDIYVAPKLPDGLDPDEFVIREGMEAWRKHIDSADHAFTYMARFILHKHDITNDHGKISAITEAFSYSKQFTQIKDKLSLSSLFWKEICQRLGIDKEELFGCFENSSGDGDNGDRSDNGDQTNVPNNHLSSEETHWCGQRENWNSPVSYQGEIGFWKKDKDDNYFFDPACNFDFQVEREIEDADGGGLVLQVKRSFENRRIRVILNSTDYTKTDTFTDALKRALKTGIVCNLSKTQLNALIHTRLHEYRTTRQGRLFKRIDRYGQQADGTWVFRDRQYKKDGTPTNENESGWIFNPNLGKDDYIPCPELAPTTIDPHSALKELIEASQIFFTQKNFYQAILMLGSVVAGLYYQDIRRENRSHPQVNAFGDPGSQKTHAAETGLSLIGTNWADAAMFSRVSASALFEHASRTGSLTFVWDDPPRDPKNEELGKHLFNGKPRKVRSNEQMPHSSMIATTNHAYGGDQAATYTRNVRINFKQINDEDILDPKALQKLSAAQSRASAAFPLLLKLGYPHQKVMDLESQLLHYLPNAHARIAKGLAIITWYAQALIDLVGGKDNILQWVIDNCCASENSTDTSGDSLKDFIDKILALEAESLVGNWNFKRQVERNGRQFYAIYNQDIWKLVDQKFKPATYNDKSLKALLFHAGGIVDTTVRFSCDRDQALAYNRMLLTAGQTESGEPIINSVKTIPRKAWLIPAELFGEVDEVDQAVTAVTECNRNPVTPPNPDETSTCDSQNANCNRVTEKNSFKEKEKTEETGTGTEQQINLGCNQNSGYSSYTPSAHQKNEDNQGFQDVTENQLQPVTRLQVGDKVIISHDLHPHKGARLQVIGIHAKYLICEYLYGKKKGQTILLEPREVEKI